MQTVKKLFGPKNSPLAESLRCLRGKQHIRRKLDKTVYAQTRCISTTQHVNKDFRPEVGQVNNLMDIGTRRILDEDKDLFRENVRRFFTEEVSPYHAQWEKDGQVSRELWLKAGEQGLLGVNTPAEIGGIGGDFIDSMIVLEEQCYSNCSGPGFILHSDVVMPYLRHFGTKEQLEKYIPDMVAGKKIGAIAMTEPGAGSDLQGIRTNAVKDGDDWILNGSKVFITNGFMSDVVIVVAVTNTEAKSKAHGISLFLVDAGTPGFKKGKKLEKIGLKAQDTSELFFEDVRLGPESVLGEINKGFYYLMMELPQERLMAASIGQAACEWMFEETRAYIKQRKAFGKTIADLQVTQHKMAEMKTEICIGRAFIDQCYELHSVKKLDSYTASMAKYWHTDLQNKLVTQCLQLHGGWGYMLEYPIARCFLDSRVQPIYAGSNEIMKELIARPIVS
ncbi:unnamed protein product [Owenia fusiformis]|uniref:Long-chain specific acyl-CoA dehydrogenase, mitochondrial n=1 Tax=Owenia fusiformis TaxID=6347 RepID=A0A8S4N148_OWEFU|nr:unnamed protein product [Owenia fusiformis]